MRKTVLIAFYKVKGNIERHAWSLLKTAQLINFVAKI